MSILGVLLAHEHVQRIQVELTYIDDELVVNTGIKEREKLRAGGHAIHPEGFFLSGGAVITS